MTLTQKIAKARAEFEEACETLKGAPAEPEAWRIVCSTRARLVALFRVAGMA